MTDTTDLSNDGLEKTKNQYSMAFYNVENLFDTIDDAHTLDDDFTEDSEKRWNTKRFQKKIKKLSRVISSIGYNDIFHPPVLIGLAEVENRDVLETLVQSKSLKKKNYGIVHFDSPDERGIDTALLYRKDFFTVTQAKAHTVYLTNEEGVRDFTRDILHVSGVLQGETINILVNHWPSRRAGAEKTEHKRLAAAARNREVISEITSENSDARIIIMGDFNDDPNSKSITHLLGGEFYNPMEVLLTNEDGSLSYRGNWNLFDQIIVSHNFMRQHGNDFRFQEAKIFNPKDLQEYDGRNKGTPFRTYAGRKYIGGMSDHFPVYGIFSIELLG